MLTSTFSYTCTLTLTLTFTITFKFLWILKFTLTLTLTCILTGINIDFNIDMSKNIILLRMLFDVKLTYTMKIPIVIEMDLTKPLKLTSTGPL